MNQSFNITRVFLFIKRDLLLLRGTITASLAVAAILIFLFSIFNMIWDKQLTSEEFVGIFTLVFIPMGLLFSFALFREFSSPKTNHLYLALPVSTSERLLSKWITATLLYIVTISIIALAVGFIALLVGGILFGANLDPLALFSSSYWSIVGVYLFIQPIFMVGAMTFAKNRLVKTLLALGLLTLGFIVFHLILFGLLNGGFDVMPKNGMASVSFIGADFSTVGRWFYGLLFGPFMLVVAYFKMKEKEV